MPNPKDVQYEVVYLLYLLQLSNRKGEEPTKQSHWFQSLLHYQIKLYPNMYTQLFWMALARRDS